MIFLIFLLLHVKSSSESAHQGHLKPLGQSGPNFPIAEIDGFVPPREFVSKYLAERQPFVMRGAVKDHPAFEKWTDSYLRSKAPAGYQIPVTGKDQWGPAELIWMNLTEFLDTYNHSDIYMTALVPPYLSQDLILPFSLQCAAFEGSLKWSFLWISSGGTYVKLHADLSENINCLYRGQKQIVLINSTQYEDKVDVILDSEKVGFPHSSVAAHRVDLEKYPHFKGMHFHVTNLSAGDCIYIPYMWMHFIGSTDSNLAVNIWFKKEKVKSDVANCPMEEDRYWTFDKVRFRKFKRRQSTKGGKEESEAAEDNPQLVDVTDLDRDEL